MAGTERRTQNAICEPNSVASVNRYMEHRVSLEGVFGWEKITKVCSTKAIHSRNKQSQRVQLLTSKPLISRQSVRQLGTNISLSNLSPPMDAAPRRLRPPTTADDAARCTDRSMLSGSPNTDGCVTYGKRRMLFNARNR